LQDKIHFDSTLWEKVFHLLQKKEEKETHHGLLYHYTTPAGLLGILQNQHIWATEASFLNDLYEIQYGLDMTKEVINTYLKNKDTYKQQFCELSLNYLEHMNSKEEEIYITSFCETSDLLSQWKGYTNFGEGYAVGLNLENMIDSNSDEEFGHISIKKVIYNKKMQSKMVKSKIKFMVLQSQKLIAQDLPNTENIMKASAKSLAYYLNAQSKRFKSSAFSEEKEWRAIYINNDFANEQRIKNKLRMVDSILTPYIELHLYKKNSAKNRILPIKEIIIGPKVDGKKAGKSINLIYKNLEVKLPKIKESKITLQ